MYSVKQQLLCTLNAQEMNDKIQDSEKKGNISCVDYNTHKIIRKYRTKRNKTC